MRPRRLPRLRAAAAALVAALAPAAFGGADGAWAETSSAGAADSTARSAATAHVEYLSGASAYVSAGRLDGLVVGDTLTVERDGRPIARLRIAYISARRAACDTLATAEALRVGDLVRLPPRPPAAPPLSLEGPPPPAPPAATASGTSGALETARGARPAAAAARRGRPVRGRIGVRYLTLRNARGASAELSQPALDVRLDGANIGGVPVDVTVDARGRRTSQSLDVSTETHESLRIYRLSATVHDVSGRRRATLGRQTAAALSTLSLFDGLLVETAGERWSVGLLTGTQPLGRDLGVSGDILQHGGYVALRQRAGAPRRWSVSLGAVSSWRGSTSNRDVVVAQGTYADRRWSLFVTQEADVNRGWRRASGEQAVSPTSTYALARAQATPDIALTLGYDNRRSVRLYRDRETPETEFDDSHRQGVWGGASFDVSDRVRLAVDARARDGSAGGSTRTWSAATDVRPPVRAVDRLRCRVAESWGAATRTRLASVGAGVSPIWALRIDLEAGVRETEDDLAADPRETAGWERVALDFNVAGRWYLNTSLERDHGEQEDIRQVDVGLTWRL